MDVSFHTRATKSSNGGAVDKRLFRRSNQEAQSSKLNAQDKAQSSKLKAPRGWLLEGFLDA
jgi:hypothetical protein